MKKKYVELSVRDGIATITLNRPEKLNAINLEMWDDLDEALEEVRGGSAVRVVRIRGAGRSFCSGYDMVSNSSVYSMDASGAASRSSPPGSVAPVELEESRLIRDRERLRGNIERWLRMWNYRKPIVAQVHGHCLAGGLDLVGVVDIVCAAENAKFGHPASRGLGIPPTLGMMPMKIGASRTKRLLFTGDTVDGLEAERIGLVDEVFSADRLEDETLTLCRRIANVPSDALNLHKHVVNRWSDIMGLRLGALEGAEFDAMFHETAASNEFGRIVYEHGLKAALAWRDADFNHSSR